jgi:hypothetical protein
MTDPRCPIFFGLGWVCENHPQLAWSDEFGCQCGAGMPCECNQTEDFEEPDTSEVIEQSPTPRIR